MAEVTPNLTALRPGGSSGLNPFSAFSQGAGVKAPTQKIVASSSATPHKELLDERKKQLGVDRVAYTAQFMMQFAERNNRAPAGLSGIKGLVLDDVTKTTAPTSTLSSAPGAPEGDNWRAKPAGGGGSSSAAAASSAASGTTAAAAAAAALPDIRIQKAEDIGRTAWAPAKDLTSTKQATQKLRGILNKLTPDNYDKLVGQVLGITSVNAETLRMCIPLIFEKAVAEPTFCALYASLCSTLSRELEGHDFGSDAGKPVAFKRELLNTCQDEYESTEGLRAALDPKSDSFEKDRRNLKMRQLGTTRLLAELFNKDLVTHVIMRIVVSEYMDRALSDGKYDTDLIECIVQALTISGAKMSEHEKLSKHVKAWLVKLDKWSNDSTLEARIRFKIKDLHDQVKMGWQTRRKTNTVQKTEDIRKQAHAELGMVQTAVPDFLPGLNIGAAVQQKAKQDDSVLFPGMGDPGMPMDASSIGIRPDWHDAAKESSAGPPRGHLSDADLRKKAHGTFQEFLSIRDFKEAETCVVEMAPTPPQAGLIVSVALQNLFDATKDAERELLYKIVVHLADIGLLSEEAISLGLREHTDNLEDLTMDVPLSPKILGHFIAAVALANKFQLSALEGMLEKTESCDPKRRIFIFLARTLQEEVGEAGAAQLFKESGLRVGPLLDADKEIDPGVPSVFDFVKLEGLEWVPL